MRDHCKKVSDKTTRLFSSVPIQPERYNSGYPALPRLARNVLPIVILRADGDVGISPAR
jgi:hypothetical protein